jgi:hypothetical protein
MATGRPMPAGIDLPGVVPDSFDALHIRTWNFMPSLMRHVGVAPMWVVRLLDGVWVVMAVALLVVLVRMWRMMGAGAGAKAPCVGKQVSAG